MRSLLRGRRAYIDTDIYAYVALKHPAFHDKCYEVLRVLVSKEFTGYTSHLVLFELSGALAEISVEAAHEAVSSLLDLPLTMLEVGRDTLRYAKEIAALSGVTYDSLHAALVAQHRVDVVITEDLRDWRRILGVRPEVRRRLKVGDLAVVSPTRGVLGGRGC